MPRSFFYITVFITGTSVMAVEMAASRLLAPYFGSSIIVWANIIGVILAALSAGYFLGGRIAVKNKNPRNLFLVIFITGLFIDFIPLIGKMFLTAFIGHEVFGSLISVLVLFGAPFLLLGMVSPWIIHLATSKVEEVGNVAGAIYGISTIGSIVGVFLPVFATIPFIGTQNTIFLFGTILALLGLVGMARKAWLIVTVLLLPIVFFYASRVDFSPTIVAKAESLYNFLYVRNISDSFYLQVNEGRGVQSVYNPNQNLTNHYWDYAALLPILNPDGKNFLIIGLATGTSSRIVKHFFPKIEITGVEIDKQIIDLGKIFFALDDKSVDIKIQDGRMFLAQNKQKFDFMMIDVYAQEYVIPFHLATQEFFKLAQQNLSPDGIVIMNVAQFNEKTDMLDVLKNTFSSVFEHAYYLQVPNTQNFILFGFSAKGGQKDLLIDEKFIPFELKPLFENFAEGFFKIDFIPSGNIFTDDKASIELYTY